MPNVPIPEFMKDLPVDPRGYPIPYIVLKDDDGTAHFIVNDHHAVVRCTRHDLCSICGKPLETLRMFVGGVRNAFHRNGAYIDPPMHPECCRYALQVCPFLAVPSYHGVKDVTKHIERVQADATFVDNTSVRGKPVMFVAIVVPQKYDLVFDGSAMVFKPHRPYRSIEYWRDGKQLAFHEGKEIRDAVLSGKLEPTIL